LYNYVTEYLFDGGKMGDHKNSIAIVNGRIILPYTVIENGVLLIKDGKIHDVGNKDDISVPNNFEVINADGHFVSPGLIDLHVNGGGNGDVMDGTVESITKMRQTYIKFGTTGILPSIISAPNEKIIRAIKAIKSAMDLKVDGTKILGIHLEGPFLNENKKGAHKKEYLQEPSISVFKKYLEASNNTIKILSFAPELKGGKELIEFVCNKGIIVGIAHSGAFYEDTIEAIKSGVTYASHTFNGMTGMTSREPGAVGAILLSENVYAELIADGHHVHPKMIDIMIRVKGTDKTILVTDAMKPTGTSTTSFEIDGMKVFIRNGGSFNKEGILCGSVLTMNKAIKNIIDWTNLPVHSIVKMASLNPARAIGLDSNVGSIEIGKDANIVFFDDDFNAKRVFLEGKPIQLSFHV